MPPALQGALTKLRLQAEATKAPDLQRSGIAVAVGVVPVLVLLAILMQLGISLATDGDLEVNRFGLIIRGALIMLSAGFGAVTETTFSGWDYSDRVEIEATLRLGVTIIPVLVLAGVALATRRLERERAGAEPGWWIATRTAAALALALFVLALLSSYTAAVTDDFGRTQVDVAARAVRPALLGFLGGWIATWSAVTSRSRIRSIGHGLAEQWQVWVRAVQVAAVAVGSVLAVGAIALTLTALILTQTSGDSVDTAFGYQLLAYVVLLPTLVVWAVSAAMGTSMVLEGSGFASAFDDAFESSLTETFGTFGNQSPPLWWSLLGLAVVAAALYLAGVWAVNRFGEQSLPAVLRAALPAGVALVILNVLASSRGTVQAFGSVDLFDGMGGGDGTVRMSLVGVFFLTAFWTAALGWAAHRTAGPANDVLSGVPVVGALIGAQRSAPRQAPTTDAPQPLAPSAPTPSPAAPSAQDLYSMPPPAEAPAATNGASAPRNPDPGPDPQPASATEAEPPPAPPRPASPPPPPPGARPHTNVPPPPSA